MTITEPWLGSNPAQIPVSNSEIQTFKECKRKWWLQYYSGLSSKKQDIIGPLPLGTRVHLALEMFYKHGIDPVDAYNESLAEDRELFNNSPESAFPDKVKEFDSDAELGRLMVEGYLEWLEETHADQRYDYLETEKEITAPLFEGKILLRGKVDQRVLDKIDDAVYTMDHKTAASFSMYHNTAHMSEQLLTYLLLERLQSEVSGGRIVEGGIYNLLKKVKRTPKAKPPFYERIVVRFNNESLKSFWIRLHGTLLEMLKVREQLDSGVDHRYVAYPTPTKDCSWKCPFFSSCTMFDDGSDAERWLNTYMKKVDPYARYLDEIKKVDEGL